MKTLKEILAEKQAAILTESVKAEGHVELSSTNNIKEIITEEEIIEGFIGEETVEETKKLSIKDILKQREQKPVKDIIEPSPTKKEK